MNFLSNKQGFLGIDNKFKIKEKAIIVPFGLEKTVSYGGGTKIPWVTLSIGDLAVKILLALIMLIPFRLLLSTFKAA